MSFFNFIKIITYLPLRVVFPTKIYNKNKYFNEKSVLCVNHYTSEDVLIVSQRFLWGKCRCVGKEELFNNKAVAWFLEKMGAISIKRGESDIGAYKKIADVLKQGHQLLIFPEGTRNKGGTDELLPFQEGASSFAMKFKCPVIPMVFYKPLKPFRRNYIMVGDSIDLSEFSSLPPHEARAKATEFLYEKMTELKKTLAQNVENKKKK